MLNIIRDVIQELARMVVAPPGSYGSFLGFCVAFLTLNYLPFDIVESGNMDIFHKLILTGWFISCIYFFAIVTAYIIGKIKDMK